MKLCLIFLTLIVGSALAESESSVQQDLEAPEQVQNAENAVDSRTVIAEEENAEGSDIIEAVEEEEDEEMIIDPVSGRRKYDSYRLLRVVPESKEQLEILKFIARGKRVTYTKSIFFTLHVDSLGVEDYWTPIPGDLTLHSNVDMLISPKHYDHVSSYLNCSGVPFVITINDLQKEIDDENVPAAEDDDVLGGRQGTKMKSSK